MKPSDKPASPWRLAVSGAAACTLLGLALFAWSNELINLAYDLMFPLKSTGRAGVSDVVILYMDDHSFAQLNQANRTKWDRRLHAGLLDRLTRDQARVVVFDIIFDTASEPSADEEFERAIRRNGHVVLAASQDEGTHVQVLSQTVVRPIERLLNAAAAWGVTGVLRPKHDDAITRQFFIGDELKPSLPWAAATVAGLPLTRARRTAPEDTRLNFYGPPLHLPNWSYSECQSQPPGFFRDKYVFIGFKPKTSDPMDRDPDKFATPYSRLRFWADMSGVEIVATAFLNLLRNDGMRQVPTAAQLAIILALGLAAGFGLALLRPLVAGGIALAAMLGLFLLALQLAQGHWWFAWTIPAFVQIPLAWCWAVGGRYVRLRFEKDVLTRTLEETTRLVEATRLTAQKPAQLVPDHELVRLVGKGAYGDVWLARNAVGVFHAVKIVRRAAFPSDVPYEREFRGIQKFMPVSRTHPGLVHVLHVGRNDAERCFYCIMEAGDDQTTGQKIDPDSYLPKSLGSELKWRGRLSPEETVKLGLALAIALDHLHQHRLIHRDIKPGNIIYVSGQPKFADIGLVTDIAGDGRDVSFLGTQGYIPPEGPGSPGADVYALGKVLYEAAMGRDRELFPEVPTAVYEEPDDSLLRRLQGVIFKACEEDAAARYRTAAELHAALSALAANAPGTAQ